MLSINIYKKSYRILCNITALVETLSHPEFKHQQSIAQDRQSSVESHTPFPQESVLRNYFMNSTIHTHTHLPEYI